MSRVQGNYAYDDVCDKNMEDSNYTASPPFFIFSGLQSVMTIISPVNYLHINKKLPRTHYTVVRLGEMLAFIEAAGSLPTLGPSSEDDWSDLTNPDYSHHRLSPPLVFYGKNRG